MSRFYTPKTVWERYSDRLMTIYTKVNPRKDESLENGTFRSLWGVMISSTQLQVHLLEVISNGLITDRSVCYVDEKKHVITLRSTDKLTMIGQKRYPNN